MQEQILKTATSINDECRRRLVGHRRGAHRSERVIEDGSLFAPELVRVEVTNIIRRLERAKEITEHLGVASQCDQL